MEESGGVEERPVGAEEDGPGDAHELEDKHVEIDIGADCVCTGGDDGNKGPELESSRFPMAKPVLESVPWWPSTRKGSTRPPYSHPETWPLIGQTERKRLAAEWVKICERE